MINPMAMSDTAIDNSRNSVRPMSRFKEMYIYCSEADARNFFLRLYGFLTAPSYNGQWSLYEKGMELMEGDCCFRKGLFACILLNDTQKQPYASVTLSYEEGKNYIWLCNIVPCQTTELSHAQYNEILDQFYREVVDPIRQTLDCTTTSGTFTGSEIMTSGSWKLLSCFNALANQTSLHPSDNKTWHRFVISVFHNDKDLDSTTLGRILHEELGWSEDKALQLVVRYEDEIDLLREYTNG